MVRYWVPLISTLFFSTNCGADSSCCEKVSLHYLHEAVNLIAKAKYEFLPLTGVKCEKSLSRNALDCSELFELGYKENGLYTVWPQSRVMDDKPLEVYCDMETDGGGWTVIQRRGPFGNAMDYFYKDWKSYKEGFGDLEKEFWLGNDNIYALTNRKNYSARFDLKAADNETRYAHYDTFWIDDEYNMYTLHIANYSGDAGDSMSYRHNHQKFSTIDKDNDNAPSGKCTDWYQGCWWYGSCLRVNLNGPNVNGAQNKSGAGINWMSWRGLNESLQATEIKIRPRNFKLLQDSLNNTTV